MKDKWEFYKERYIKRMKKFEESQMQAAEKKILVKVKNTFEVVGSAKQKSPAPNKS